MQSPDVYSTTLFLQVYSAIIGVIALVLWRLHKDLHGLLGVAVGYMGLALAFSMMQFRTPVMIIIYNTVVVFAAAMLCDGLVTFMGGKRRTGIVVTATLFVFCTYVYLCPFTPDTLGLRIVLSSCLIILLFCRPLVLSFQQTKTYGLAGYAMFFSLMIYTGSIVCRVLVTTVFGGPLYVFGPGFHSWFLLVLLVAASLSFFSLTLMVGTRLSNTLHERNMTLEAERRVQAQLRQFLHALGHELRTPLAIIDRSTEMMEVLLEKPPADIQKRLDTIRGTVERTGGMIDNLLNSERVESSTATFENLDFVKVVGDTVAVMAEKYDAHRLQVSLPSEEVWVFGNKDLLSIAVQNLVDNALKFSPPQAPVSIRLYVGKGEATLCVSDQGVGLPEEDLTQLGKRFYRGSNTEGIKGSGLGLHLVYEIISKHKGRVELQTAYPQGTEACLYLPRV